MILKIDNRSNERSKYIHPWALRLIEAGFVFYLFIYTIFNEVAQLAINNYSTLWPSKQITQYIHIYNITKEQLNTRV